MKSCASQNKPPKGPEGYIPFSLCHMNMRRARPVVMPNKCLRKTKRFLNHLITHVCATGYSNSWEPDDEGMPDVSFSVQASDNPSLCLRLWEMKSPFWGWHHCFLNTERCGCSSALISFLQSNPSTFEHFPPHCRFCLLLRFVYLVFSTSFMTIDCHVCGLQTYFDL